MESSQRRTRVSNLLSAFFLLTFIGHGVSSLAQLKRAYYGEKTGFVISKLDDAVTREFQKAWRLSRNCSDGYEGLVLVYPTHDGRISARSQGKSDEPKHFTFGWTANIIAVVHTHPNGDDPRPGGADLRLADRFAVPVFTITQRGMYVYDPETRKISMVQQGLDWLDPLKWVNDPPPEK